MPYAQTDVKSTMDWMITDRLRLYIEVSLRAQLEAYTQARFHMILDISGNVAMHHSDVSWALWASQIKGASIVCLTACSG